MSAKMIHDRSSEWMPIEHAAPGIDLNLLMLFLEIVNAKSISQTAVRLQIPKATLSRKLRQLEQQVGAVLPKRGPVVGIAPYRSSFDIPHFRRAG